MEYPPYDKGEPFYAYYKNLKNRGNINDENRIYRRGTVGHVSVNLSLIPTALSQGYEALYIGSKNGIEREMIESQLPEIVLSYFEW